MEHTKKLLLVDPKLYRPSMREKTLSKLDEEIEQTLNGDLPDEQKVDLYLTSLKKYKHYSAVESKQPETKVDFETEVLQSTPTTQQYKAKRLLDHIKRNKDAEISKEGELIYKQQTLQGSRIVDLIGDVLQKSPGTDNPTGWKEFADALKSTNAPRDLVLNADRWKYMHPPQPKSFTEDTRKLRKEQRKSWEGPEYLSETPKSKKKAERTKLKTWLQF